jgi:tape measure domain-containing protein
MAEERPIVIRFIGEDKVTTVANKVTNSVDSVAKSAGKTSGKLSNMTDSLNGVTGSLTDVASAAGLTGGAIGSVAMSIGSMLGPIGIAVGTVIGLGAALFTVGDASAKTADRVNNLKRSIISLADTKDEGEELYKTLMDIASRTPFEQEDIIEMGRSLLNAGVDAEKIPDYIYAIGDSVTTIGGSAQTIDSITTAIGRMTMQNKLSYEQMMQIQENGIPVFKLLAEATGRTTEEVIKLSQEGLLPAEKNIDIIISAMQGTYGDAMASQLNTATQAASNFNDTWKNVSAEFGTWVTPVINSIYEIGTSSLISLSNSAKDFENWSGRVRVALDDSGLTSVDSDGLFAMSIRSLGGIRDTIKLIYDDIDTGIREIIKGNGLLEVSYEAVKLAFDTYIASQLGGLDSIITLLGKLSGVADGGTTSGKSFAEAWGFANGQIIDMTTGTRSATSTIGIWVNTTKSAMKVVHDLNVATKENTDKTKDNNDAQRERDRILREIEQATNEYKSTLTELRTSYMDIADAERSVADAEKALRDAQDPLRIQSMALALQAQQMSLKDLNESMAEMRARRDEIAQSLKGMTDEQIRYNALTQKERDQYKALGKDLEDLKKRRDAVRKALAGNKLTNQQRVEFMQTEAALNALIGQKTDERQTIEQKQADALKKAEAERLRLLEEDKRLREELEKAQLRYQQQLVSIAQAQRDLSEAQDPNRLDRYRDAVTRARYNLEELRAEQLANAINANDLAKKLGITSEVMDVLTKSASDTATPLDDAAVKSLDLSKAVSEDGGATESVGDLAKNFDKLDADSTSAVSGLTKVEGALKSLDALKLDTKLGVALKSIGDGVASIARSNEMFSVDNLTAPLTSIRNLAMELGTTESLAFSKWSDAYRNAVNGSTNSTAITNLIRALDALRDTVDGRSGTSGGGVGGRSGGGVGSRGGTRSIDGLGAVPTYENTASVQNITINLHYATPPSSNTPLKDVEDYLAAQGGRLRI